MVVVFVLLDLVVVVFVLLDLVVVLLVLDLVVVLLVFDLVVVLLVLDLVVVVFVERYFIEVKESAEFQIILMIRILRKCIKIVIHPNIYITYCVDLDEHD
jgi:hypothetical protein